MTSAEAVALLAVAAVSIAVWGSSVALLIRYPERHWRTAGHDKRAWAIIQVVAGFSALGVITGLAFLIFVWPRLRRAARSALDATSDPEQNAPQADLEDGQGVGATALGVLVIGVDRSCAVEQRLSIEVDGPVVARLRREEVERLVVPAGSHRVRARLDWLSSPEATVVIPAGGEVVVVVSAEHDVGSLEKMLVLPEEALDLHVEPSWAGGAGSAAAMSTRLGQRLAPPEDLDGPFRRSR